MKVMECRATDNPNLPRSGVDVPASTTGRVIAIEPLAVAGPTGLHGAFSPSHVTSNTQKVLCVDTTNLGG